MVCTNMACNYLVTRLEALGDRKPAPRQPSIPSIGGRLSPDCCRSHAPWGAFTIAMTQWQNSFEKFMDPNPDPD